MAGAAVPNPNDWDKYKVKSAPDEDWSKYAVPKKAPGNGGGNTPLPSSNGGIPDLVSPQSTNVPLTPQYAQQQDDQQRQASQDKLDKANKDLQKVYSQLSPDEKSNWDKLNSIAHSANPDRLSAPTDEELAHQKFMDAHPVLRAVTYLGSKASKGALQVVKGAAHIAKIGLNSNPYAMFGDDPDFSSADKFTDYGLTKTDLNNIESGKGMGNKALSTGGMMAEFAPSVAGGELSGAPKSLLFLQGVGQGKETADKIPGLNPVAKEALIQGSGVVNLALADLGGEYFGKGASSAIKDKVVTGITADALKDAAGKDLTEQGFKELLQQKSADFVTKFKQAPIEALRHYNETAKTLLKLDVGNFALHKGVDALNGKPVFNETPGDLAEGINKSLTQDAPIFAAIPAAGELTKLTPLSGYKNDVVDALVKDPSRADDIKQQLQDHGQQNGWTPEETQATLDHVDKIAQASKSIPDHVEGDKREKAVGLVVDRNSLQDELAKEQSEKSKLDPALQEQTTPKEQYLLDKIDQANDKLRSVVSGKRTTYSQPEEGKYFKTTDGEQEKIEPGRYDLERLERDAKENNSPLNTTENEKDSNNQEESSNDQEANVETNGKETVPNEEGNVTSIKNAKIDEDRENRGQSPLMSETAKDFPHVWDEAMKRIDKDPDVGRDLVKELNDKPRATTDVENALIAHHLVETKNKYDDLNRQIVEAQDKGEPTEPLEDKLDRVSDDLHTIETVARKTGTETGRGLNSRKMMIRDDMSLSSLETKKRVALGRALTPEEREDVRKVHADYEAKSKAYETKIAELEQRNKDLQERQTLDDLKREAKKENRSKTRASRQQDRAQLIDDIRAKLKAARGQANSSIPYLNELIAISPELAKLAKSYIADGIDKLDELVDKIHNDLKETFPDLDKRAVRDALSGYGKEPEKETKPELQRKLEELKREAKLLSKLEDLQAKEYKAPERKKAAYNAEIEDLRKQIAELTDNDRKLSATKTRLKNEIEAIEKEIKTGEKPPEKSQIEYDAEATKLKDKRDELKEQLNEINKDEIDAKKKASTLKSIKTRTANAIKQYEQRLRDKDFSPNPPRTPTELDPEAVTAKGELNRVKSEYEAELEKDRLANRGKWEKGWDKFLKYRRAELLLNLSGAAKVGMASAYRILSQPLHELTGEVVKRAFPGVAAKAAREGHGFVSDVEWKALKTVWSVETLSEVKKKFKGKLDNLDTAFGDKKEHFDTDRILDLAGNIHSAEKEFAKQNEFRRSVLLRTKHAEANGIDTDNPFVQLKIGMDALQDANRQIFMGDNLANSAYRELLGSLESKSKATKFGRTAKITAGALRLLLPIVKVPTNYLIEKAQYTPILGAVRAVAIMSRGLEKMKPEEADYVMRVMKKQGIGLGLVAMGYYNADNFGGFHIPGKKHDPNDPLQAGDVKVFGVSIPHFLTHTPLLTLLQLGATLRRASAGDVAMGTANDFAESTPFYETPKEAVKAMESANSMQEFVGAQLRGLIVPNVVTQAAEHFDKDENGQPIKRSPKNIPQGIEEGIPGLRQNVPIKNPHPDFDKIHLPDRTYQLNNNQIQERQKYYDSFMKSDGAKEMLTTIAKTTNTKQKEDLQKKLKTMASKVSKMKLLSAHHNSQTGSYDLEKVDD